MGRRAGRRAAAAGSYLRLRALRSREERSGGEPGCLRRARGPPPAPAAPHTGASTGPAPGRLRGTPRPAARCDFRHGGGPGRSHGDASGAPLPLRPPSEGRGPAGPPPAAAGRRMALRNYSVHCGGRAGGPPCRLAPRPRPFHTAAPRLAGSSRREPRRRSPAMAKEGAQRAEETEQMIEKEGGKEAAEGSAAGSLRAGDAKEMRAVVLSAFGGLNKLRVSKKAMPEPQEGELKIRVKAWSSIASRPLLPPGAVEGPQPRGGRAGCGPPSGGREAGAAPRTPASRRPPLPVLAGLPCSGACLASGGAEAAGGPGRGCQPRRAARGGRAAVARTSLTCGFPPSAGAPLRAASAASCPPPPAAQVPAAPRGSTRAPRPGIGAEPRVTGTGRARGEAAGSRCGGEGAVVDFHGTSREKRGQKTGQLRSGFCCFRSEKCGCQLACGAQHLSLPLPVLAVIFLLGISYFSHRNSSLELARQRSWS